MYMEFDLDSLNLDELLMGEGISIDEKKGEEPVENLDQSTGLQEVKKPSTLSAVSPLDSYFSVDEDILSNYYGVTPVSIDKALPSTRVEKYRAKKGVRDRIACLTNHKYEVRYHWSEEFKQQFFCFDGQCCEDLGAPMVRFVRPIVQYTVDNKGKIIEDGDLKIKFLVCNRKTDEILQTLAEQAQDLTAIDLVVTTDNEDYQNLSILPIGNCTWRQNPYMQKMVKELWDQSGKYFLDSVASRMTPEEYFAKKNSK